MLERSSLGRPVDVLRCTTQDGYVLTHAVMHGTDLGVVVDPPPAPGRRAPRRPRRAARASRSTPTTSTSPPSCCGAGRCCACPGRRRAVRLRRAGPRPAPARLPAGAGLRSGHARGAPGRGWRRLRPADVVPRHAGVRHPVRRDARHRHHARPARGSGPLRTTPRAGRRGAGAHLAARTARCRRHGRPGPDAAGDRAAASLGPQRPRGGPPPPGAGPRARPGRRPGGAPVGLAVAARYGAGPASADAPSVRRCSHVRSYVGVACRASASSFATYAGQS